MKEVIWIGPDGRKHKSLIRDHDPEHLAQSGVPLDPPDIFRLDWEMLKTELHNALVERGLSTWSDVNAQQSGVTSAILSVFKRPIIGLYRERDREAKLAQEISGG